ncbi:MAG: GspE/PulE family protein [bacterium]
MNLKEIISAEYAFSNNVLPLRLENNILTIGMVNKNNNQIQYDLNFETGFEINIVEVSKEALKQKLNEFYDQDINIIVNDTPAESKEQLMNDTSVINFVNNILDEAIKSKASDIHFESLVKSFRVRCRIDGHLQEMTSVPSQKGIQIISRIKILANLDISEKRRPQDGKISYQYNQRGIDIRVSSLPTSFGEKVVLRILDKGNLQLSIDNLGLNDTQKNLLVKKLKLPFGLILVTGPTGSGKTTTLYSSLLNIHTIDKNIMTVEDPIEYNLDGINQSNVKQEIGYDFAHALRAFLRQDPDVIMVGEIRDKETAEIAIRAALTGHLVFSTLHTNDSVSGITRLIDMGIEPFLVASSVKLIAAQRLVRKLCDCKVEDTERQIEIGTKVYMKKGCNKCNQIGYKGRKAIFELFEVTDEISDMISSRKTENEIKSKLSTSGFFTLKDSGYEKIKNGETSYEEVIRETSF